MTIIQPRAPSCRDVIDLWRGFQSDLVPGASSTAHAGLEGIASSVTGPGRRAAHAGSGSIVRLS